MTYAVIPETVGQQTGLTDKNGVKIFEGDICRFKRFNDIYVGQIVFNVKTASFVMWYSSTVGAYGEKATHKMLLSVCDEIEVIGNIHDNPEILKNSNPQTTQVRAFRHENLDKRTVLLEVSNL